MNDEIDPLTSLFTSDAKATDRVQLASLLQSFLSINQESREFNFLPAFYEIKRNTSKIEVLLAGAKASALYFNVPDGLFPADIILLEIMPEGSVKTSLKKLYDKDRKIKQDKEGRYFIPSFRIPELAKQFTN